MDWIDGTLEQICIRVPPLKTPPKMVSVAEKSTAVKTFFSGGQNKPSLKCGGGQTRI